MSMIFAHDIISAAGAETFCPAVGEADYQERGKDAPLLIILWTLLLF